MYLSHWNVKINKTNENGEPNREEKHKTYVYLQCMRSCWKYENILLQFSAFYMNMGLFRAKQYFSKKWPESVGVHVYSVLRQVSIAGPEIGYFLHWIRWLHWLLTDLYV